MAAPLNAPAHPTTLPINIKPSGVRKHGFPSNVPNLATHSEVLVSDFPRRYTKHQDLGIGGEGRIELWENTTTKIRIAIKVVKQVPLPREVLILRDLPPHKSIVQFLAWFYYGPYHQYSFILYEYCSGGDLLQLDELAWTRSKSALSEACMWAIFRQLTEAIAFLHEALGCENPKDAENWRPIIHRDVKAQNVSVAFTAKVYVMCMLTDF